MVDVWSSDWKCFLLRGNQSVCYICAQTGPWSSMFSVRRMTKQELIYMLVMIGVLFFIFRFWSLTVLLLCWQMRIPDSEPCYGHPNTKADERHSESTLIWAVTQMQSCTYAQTDMSVHAHANYSSRHPATVLRKIGCYVWQSLTFQTKDVDRILEDRRNLTMQTIFLLLQCHKNDFQRAKEGLQDSHDSTLYFM